MCKISIIIPTYNRDKLLKSAINSVINQSYKNFELLIIDDGSTDHTKNIVEEFINKHPGYKIRYFYKENSGRSAARNFGISQAKGEYITFLDSDDIYLPDKLINQINILEANPNFGMCFTNYLIMDEQENILEGWGNPNIDLSGKIYPELLFFIGTHITCPSVMVRKKNITDTGGFDINMEMCEDLDLWRRIAKKTLVYQIKEPLVIIRYRLNEKVDIKSFYQGRKYYYKKAFSEDNELVNLLKKDLLCEMYKEYGIFAFNKKNWGLGLTMFINFFFVSPINFSKFTTKKIKSLINTFAKNR